MRRLKRSFPDVGEGNIHYYSQERRWGQCVTVALRALSVRPSELRGQRINSFMNISVCSTIWNSTSPLTLPLVLCFRFQDSDNTFLLSGLGDLI